MTTALQQAHFEATLGHIFWGAARKAVEEIRFHGGDLSHFESAGSSSRNFTFKGDEKSVRLMHDYMGRMRDAYKRS